MKKPDYILACFVPFGFMMLACICLILTGTAAPFISGFAVDADDKIYVGVDREIRVYNDGVLVDSFSSRTSKGYAFTITEDGNILLSTSTQIYVLDLQGNVIDTQEDSGADMYNQIKYRKSKFVSANGDTYKLAGRIGRTHIVKNNDQIVYQISLLSLAVKWYFLFLFPAIMIGLMVQLGRLRGQGDGSVVP